MPRKNIVVEDEENLFGKAFAADILETLSALFKRGFSTGFVKQMHQHTRSDKDGQKGHLEENRTTMP